MEEKTIDLTSLYDLNKQGFALTIPLTNEELYQKLCDVGTWFKDKKYVMLLCREQADYTVFNFLTDGYKQAATNDLRECIDGRGKCLDIIYEDDADRYEIWMRINGEVYMYMLFNCYDFIVEV